MSDDSTKRIIIDTPIRKKRIITRTVDIDMIHANQLQILQTGLNPLYLSFIQKKIAGYKQQDIKKGRYSKDDFVTLNDVITRLLANKLKCIFCHSPIFLMYEDVRDGQQWTIDRIDNSVGHNVDNIDIACLNCNLSRRCKSQDNFMKNKNMICIKHD